MAEKMTVDEAITAVMQDVQFLGKNQKNSNQGFNFRGIDDVMNVCGPSMRKYGLRVFSKRVNVGISEKALNNGKTAKSVDLTVLYIWRGPAGDEIEHEVPAEAFDSGDKATAKAMSVAMRTAFIQMLCLPTNEPDPDSFSYQLATNDEREAFLERINQIHDIPQLRAMQREAKRVNAYEEWEKRGKELTMRLAGGDE